MRLVPDAVLQLHSLGNVVEDLASLKKWPKAQQTDHVFKAIATMCRAMEKYCAGQAPGSGSGGGTGHGKGPSQKAAAPATPRANADADK